MHNYHISCSYAQYHTEKNIHKREFSPRNRIVFIKVAEYNNEFYISTEKGGVWIFDDKINGKLDINKKYKIRFVLEKMANILYHVVVGEVTIRDFSNLNKTIKNLENIYNKKLSYKVIGTTIIDAKNRIISDNRRALIIYDSYDTKEQATQISSQLYEQITNNTNTINSSLIPNIKVIRETLSNAEGIIELFSNDKKVAQGRKLVIIPNTVLKLHEVEFAKGFAWHGFEDRNYCGEMIVKFGSNNNIDCILKEDLEEVISGIVPSEISYKANQSALLAQAIAARSEIISKIGLVHIGEEFDTCAEQHCQVYKGINKISKSIKEKIKSSIGLVLKDRYNNILDAVYSANCGGHTELAEYVWFSNLKDILIAKPDIFKNYEKQISLDLSTEEGIRHFILSPDKHYSCNNSKVEGGDKFRWKKIINNHEWKNIESLLGVGSIKDITEIKRGVSGRIYKMVVNGEKGKKLILREFEIRKLFGSLKSSCIIFDFKRDSNGFINSAVIYGAGFGHGVGMCQAGAQALAKNGISYKEILKHYYPKCKLEKIY